MTRKMLLGTRALFGVLVLAASIKMIFTGYCIDDAYHVVMSYRQAIGDRLFMEMWELHQTSGFLCATLIRIFMAATENTECLVIFLRVCGLLMHGLTAVFLYTTAKRIVSKEAAALIAILSFSLFPKLSALPEFSNMQYWFVTISLCLLLRAYLDNYGKRITVVLSATFFCLSVISYPTGIILAIPYFLFFFRSKKEKAKSSMIYFFSTCLLEGLVYLCFFGFAKAGKFFFTNIANIIIGDQSHVAGVDVVGNSILSSYSIEVLYMLGMSAAVAILSLIISFFVIGVAKKGSVYELTVCFSILITFAITAFLFLVKQTGYDCLKLQYLIVPLEALIALNRNYKETDDVRRFLTFAITVGGFVLIGASLVTNLDLYTNIPLLQVALIWSMLAFCYKYKSKAIIYTLLFATLISFGMTCYTQKRSGIGRNIFQYNAVVKSGPAKFIVCDSVIKKHYESGNRELSDIATENDSVFVFSNDLYAAATELYMASAARIAQYSTICTPTYGDMHLTYWGEFPDRFPTLIVVENVCEEAMEKTFIYQYLFKECNYSVVKVGEHFTYYRRTN